MNWAKAAGASEAKWGRPPHGPGACEAAREAVLSEVGRQGLTGWRPIAARLSPGVPVTLVQRSLQELKAERRRQEGALRRANRKGLEVLASGAVMTLDATHLGRALGKAIEGDVLRDRGSMRFVSVGIGPSPTGRDVVEQLEGAKREGCLPLALMTDNGSAYISGVVGEYMAREGVVHVLSRQGCPTDNPSAERGMREFKEESGLGKGVKLGGVGEAVEAALSALTRLNGRRVRVSRGGRTADESEGFMPRWYDSVDRSLFYGRATSAMAEAAKEHGEGREGRLAVREAFFGVLEEFGLAKRTGGGYAKPCVIPEGIS
jgi:transposase InsO family protein